MNELPIYLVGANIYVIFVTPLVGLTQAYRVNKPQIIHTEVIYSNSKPKIEEAVGVKKAVAGGFSKC